jgi:hypothetical protein
VRAQPTNGIRALRWIFRALLLGLLGAGLGRSPAAATERVPPVPTIPPAFGCWFWSAAEFKPEGYRPFLDLVSRHGGFDRLPTSLRVAGHEVTEAVPHDQIRRAAEYAERRGLKLVMDVDVRLARAAFLRMHPEELQEMLRIHEVELTTTGEGHRSSGRTA